ncbi:MAG: lytic transglycosylase domain-containing protein [Chitinophagales bacterium]
MKNRTLYFLTSIAILLWMALFINATMDNSSSYFPFLKSKEKKENLALPVQTTFAVKIPEQLTFAGEQVPLDDLEVRERLDRELTVNAYFQSSTLIMLKRANRWLPTIEKILKEENIPDDFKYLCMAESSLDNVISPSGAAGFWQFMKTTATQYGLLLNSEIDERYNLEKATRAACQYLRDAKIKTGSWTAAAAGYNMGTAGIINQQIKQADSSYYNLFLNSETSRYVQRILALKIIHLNQKDFGYYLTNEDLYPELKYTTQTVQGSVNWVSFAKQNQTTYKLLRLYNPWIRDYNLSNRENRIFEVKIPS